MSKIMEWIMDQPQDEQNRILRDYCEPVIDYEEDSEVAIAVENPF